MQGLGATALRAARDPVILHVRRPGKDTPYLHWVLFLGEERGMARVLDPPNTPELMPFQELMSLWDGVGLVVSKEPPRTMAMFLASWLEQGAALLLVAVTLWGTRLRAWKAGSTEASRWTVRAGRYVLRPAGLVCVAALLAGVYHSLHPEGFAGNPIAVGQVVGRHFEPPLQDWSVAQVQAALLGHTVKFIDARLPRDFEAGHMRGAINISVFAGLVERDRALSGMDPATQLVVYCQSRRCPWGRALASDLVFRGFRNVAVFSEGWSGWEQYERLAHTF
jgi:rhodanese-related sulfurtransferase